MPRARLSAIDETRHGTRRGRGDLVFFLGAVAGACVLHGLVQAYPVSLPVVAPWDFSWPIFLATALGLWWYARGLALAPPAIRPRPWRRACFLAGMATIYGVLQTHFQYLALHMFFLNRVQHVAMHHVGPFLVALGCAGDLEKRAMPAPLVSVLESRPIRAAMAVLQNPAMAGLLFVGSFFFWLVPGVHFRAMIDPRLYALMNWTMVIDGLLFWSLVLDPRPRPPARISVGMRLVLAIGVMFPQIAFGALITFADRDLYPYYDFCGRIYPAIGALRDQRLGGLIIWIPPAMMSALAVLVILCALRKHEERSAARRDSSPHAVLSSRWTGR